MSDFLETVVRERRADVERAKREVPEDVLRDRALARGRKPLRRYGTRDAFTHALWSRGIGGALAVIAEVKRVSPAAGALGVDRDVRTLARAYERAGAAAISVLCEPRHWGGALGDLAEIREVVSTPLLCKDVIVDEYQVVAAWAAGADAVLLIAEVLEVARLRVLVRAAEGLGMGVLVEAHETPAFARAVASGAAVVGVNARDLRDPGKLRPERVRMLHHLAHQEQILVAESGIGSVDDARLLPKRVNAVLVGTALMRADDPTVLIGQLSAMRHHEVQQIVVDELTGVARPAPARSRVRRREERH